MQSYNIIFKMPRNDENIFAIYKLSNLWAVFSERALCPWRAHLV